MVEQRFESTPLFLVNPQEFLSRPLGSSSKSIEELEIGRIDQPDCALLKLLPSVEDEIDEPCEVGLVYRRGKWFIFKTSLFDMKNDFIPSDADVFLHSHPFWEDAPDDVLDDSLPSIADFANCFEYAKNFVVSKKGICQFWPVFIDGQRQKREDLNGIIGQMSIGDTNDERLRFLKGVGAKYILYPWEELDDNQLVRLLYDGLTPNPTPGV